MFCKHILRIFDTDGNGFLDFKEFLMAMDISQCESGQDVVVVYVDQGGEQGENHDVCRGEIKRESDFRLG